MEAKRCRPKLWGGWGKPGSAEGEKPGHLIRIIIISDTNLQVLFIKELIGMLCHYSAPLILAFPESEGSLPGFYQFLFHVILC